MAGVDTKLVMLLVATALVMLIGEAAVDRKTVGVVPTCVIQCTTRCHYIHIPNCFSDCIKDCIPPVSNAISSDCKINCEISTCTKYASGIISFSLYIVSSVILFTLAAWISKSSALQR